MLQTFKLTLLDLVSTNKASFELISECFVIVVGTAYEGGIFRCKLVIDSEFPQKPPKGIN